MNIPIEFYCEHQVGGPNDDSVGVLHLVNPPAQFVKGRRRGVPNLREGRVIDDYAFLARVHGTIVGVFVHSTWEGDLTREAKLRLPGFQEWLVPPGPRFSQEQR